MNTATNVNTILSNEKGLCVELLHHTDDPSVWIVRNSRKFLWFRLNASTVWFFDKQQALTFAQKQKDEKRTEKKNKNIS